MKKSSNKGFTLVELIIVIAILAIIMLIAIPNFSGIQQRMQVRADKSTAAQIGKAFRIWYTEYQSDPSFKANVVAKANANVDNDTIVSTTPKMPSGAKTGSDSIVASKYMATLPTTSTVQLHTVPYFVSYVDTTLLPTSLRKTTDKTLNYDQMYWVGITGTGTGEKIAVSIGDATVNCADGDSSTEGNQPLTQANVTYDGNANGIAYLEP